MATNEIMHGPAQAAANLLGDVQAKILLLMHAKKISRATLAAALDLTKPRVTQMLRPDANMTLETLARVFVALGERPEITSAGIREALSAIDEAPEDEVFVADHQVDEDVCAPDAATTGREPIDWLSLIGRSINVETVPTGAEAQAYEDDDALQEFPMAA